MTMNELDMVLARLGQTPVPAGLAGLDERVFTGVSAGAARRIRRGVGTAAVSVALVMGIAGAVLPSLGRAPTALAPLGPVSPLSPAALLGENQ